MSDLLILSGVHTHIGRYHILHGIDFGVPEGQTTMLLGRNGAGKTSTLRTIMGLWQASAGQISLDGQRIERSATPDIARLKQDTSKIILLVEHKMDVVRSLADRIIVLHNGQLVADGKPAEVIASPIVQEAYLGIAPGRSAA